MEEKSELSDVKPPPAAEEAAVGQRKPNITAVEAQEKEPSSSLDLPINTTRKVTSALNATGLAPTQLTIFYGGSVSVFDAITAEKVRELMLIAASAAAAAEKPINAKNSGTNCPPSPIICTGSSSLQNSSSAPGSPVIQPFPDQKNSICKLQAEFPIARRHSLQRFLEKRRDRLVTKNPYPTSPAMPMDDDTEADIGNNASPSLGCFKQSAMVQEEIHPSPTAYPA